MEHVHLSNEEKARILSTKGCLGAYISKDAELLNPTEEDRKRLSIYGACLEAMQWKDEQFLQWLKENLAKETFTMFTSESQGVINFEPIIKAFEKFIKK